MAVFQWQEYPGLVRKTIEFDFRDNKYRGSLVAPPKSEGPKPLVLVIHNYQGLKFFDVDVAEFIARSGYVGLAIDLYGEDVPVDERLWPDDPKKVMSFNKKCFEAMVKCDHDHQFFRSLLNEWLIKGIEDECVDNRVSPAAIGYCFGGVAVLEAVRAGLNLSGVVSFHGLLQTGEDNAPEMVGIERPKLKLAPNLYNKDTVVLIENGRDDHLVSDESRIRFCQEMDEAGVRWIFHDYSGTPHGFALPPTLGPPGHLHISSDRLSTISMLRLFKEIFPDFKQNRVEYNASGNFIPD